MFAIDARLKPVIVASSICCISATSRASLTRWRSWNFGMIHSFSVFFSICRILLF
nr:MAG TPA: hypothetical protein [Caudoviricetes sp.]